MDSEMLLVSFAGVLLPFFSFILQSYYSYKAGTYENFKKHSMVFWGDWLLIPCIALAIIVTNWVYFILILPIGVFMSYIAHRMWANKDDPTAKHFFTDDFKKLSAAGLVHHLFSALIFSLVAAFFLTAPKENVLTAYASFTLLLFAFGITITSYHMHRKFVLPDQIISTVLAIFCLLKLLM